MPAAFDLTGRTALVTGAGSPRGIGFATARLLGEMGASVLVTSTTDRVYDRMTELRETGAEVYGVVGDLSESATAPKLVDFALERWGRLDVVVQNAGMASISESEKNEDVAETDLLRWQADLRRNLNTTLHVAHACVPVMVAAGWGRLVFVSSLTGPVMAMRGNPGYAAAKSAVVGLARALALDVAALDVTVNAVAPGWVETSSQTAHEHRQGLATPKGRSAHPDEVAAAICWLTTPGASYVTGQCLAVDGGNSIAEERA